jgi:hypothetical protein
LQAASSYELHFDDFREHHANTANSLLFEALSAVRVNRKDVTRSTIATPLKE